MNCHVPECKQPRFELLASGTSLCKMHNLNRQEAFDKIRAVRAPKKKPPFEERLLAALKETNASMKELVEDQKVLDNELEAVTDAPVPSPRTVIRGATWYPLPGFVRVISPTIIATDADAPLPPPPEICTSGTPL